MNQSIFDPFYPYIRTTQELEELVMHIDMLLQSLYIVQQRPFPEILTATLGPAQANAFLAVMQHERIQITDSYQVKGMLTSLKTTLQAFEVLTLTIPFEPTTDEISNFTLYARQHIEQNLLLKIVVNHELVGAAMIVFKGHYIDMSLKKILNAYFQTHGQEILSRLTQSQVQSANLKNQILA